MLKHKLYAFSLLLFASLSFTVMADSSNEAPPEVDGSSILGSGSGSHSSVEVRPIGGPASFYDGALTTTDGFSSYKYRVEWPLLILNNNNAVVCTLEAATMSCLRGTSQIPVKDFCTSSGTGGTMFKVKFDRFVRETWHYFGPGDCALGAVAVHWWEK